MATSSYGRTGGTAAPMGGVGQPFRATVKTPGGLRQTKERDQQTMNRAKQRVAQESTQSFQVKERATARMARGGRPQPARPSAPKVVTPKGVKGSYSPLRGRTAR